MGTKTNHMVGPLDRKGGKKSVTAWVRLVCLWIVFVLAGGVLSDGGVNASEGDGISQLTGPSQESSVLSRARVVLGLMGGSMQVQRSGVGESGAVTVVTGFPCEEELEACNHLDHGSFSEAATIFRERIAQGDDRAPIRCGLANALFLDGDLLGAARTYTWAATGYPDHPDVRNGLGNVYVQLQLFSKAVEEFQVLAAEPDYAALAHNNLGNVYRRMNRMEEALSEYQRAIDQDADLMAAYYNRAGTLLAMDKYEEAATSFRHAAQRAREFGDAFLYEGISHLRAERPVLASAALFRAEELGVDTQMLHLALGVALQEVGLDEEAVGHLVQARSEDPKNEKIYQLLSVSLVKLGQYEQAAAVLEEGFALGPQDADAHFFLGLKLFLCEQPTSAARHFLKAASLGRRKADTFFALGQALFLSGNIDPSLRSLSLAARMNPEAAEIHFALAVALMQKGDVEAAVREMKVAAALDPKDTDTQAMLMDLLRRSGDFAACARVGRQAVNQNPELVSPRFEVAYCQAMAGDLDRAVETLEDAMDHDIDGTEVLGMWKRLEGIAGSPNCAPGCYLLLGLIHERRGNWSQAVRSLEKFILRSPSLDWSRRVLEKIHDLTPRDPAFAPDASEGQ